MERETNESGLSVTERVFVVLEHCAAANRTLSLAELAIRTGMAKSTLHRVCWKLVELGGLEASSNGFRIGTKLFALGGMNPAVRHLRAMSMPVLYDLCARSPWMANLAVRSGDRALLVEELYCDERIPAQMIGARLPLHATANGKALIVNLSQREIEALAARNGLRAFTRHTIVRPDVLVEHLAKARAAGVTTASEEWHLGQPESQPQSSSTESPWPPSHSSGCRTPSCCGRWPSRCRRPRSCSPAHYQERPPRFVRQPEPVVGRGAASPRRQVLDTHCGSILGWTGERGGPRNALCGSA